MKKNIEVIGHRGVRSEEPDNTLPAFQKSLTYEIDYIDIDVVLTKDKVLLAYHDFFINPDILCYTNDDDIYFNKDNFLRDIDSFALNQVLIKNLYFDDIVNKYCVRLNKNSLYFGYFSNQKQHHKLKLSSLQDIVSLVGQETNQVMKYQIEVKSDLINPSRCYSYEVMTESIYKFIIKNNLINKVKVQSFDWRILYLLNLKNKDIKTAYLFNRNTVYFWQNWFNNSEIVAIADLLKIKKTSFVNELFPLIKYLGAYSFEIEDNILELNHVLKAKEIGLKVYTWPLPESTNISYDENLMKKIISYEVNGIITDYPKQVLNLLSNIDF